MWRNRRKCKLCLSKVQDSFSNPLARPEPKRLKPILWKIAKISRINTLWKTTQHLSHHFFLILPNYPDIEPNVKWAMSLELAPVNLRTTIPHIRPNFESTPFLWLSPCLRTPSFQNLGILNAAWTFQSCLTRGENKKKLIFATECLARVIEFCITCTIL